MYEARSWLVATFRRTSTSSTTKGGNDDATVSRGPEECPCIVQARRPIRAPRDTGIYTGLIYFLWLETTKSSRGLVGVKGINQHGPSWWKPFFFADLG